MKIISIVILIYAFLKSMFYGYYEIKEIGNKFGGIIVILLALIGFIVPVTFLIIYY